MKHWIAMIALSFIALFAVGCKEGDKTYEAAADAFKRGRYEEAVSLYELALSQGKNSPSVSAELAIAYSVSGRKDQADQMIQSALSDPEAEKTTWQRAGIFYYLNGEFEEAIRYFDSALPDEGEKLTDRDLEAYGFLAACKKETGAYDEAVEIYEKLIEKKYHPVEHKLLIADCYLKEHQFYAADQYFEWAFSDKAYPVLPEHYLYAYRKSAEAENYADSERYFQEGLSSLNGENGRMTEGEYYANAGKYAMAAEKLTDETTTGAYLVKASLAIADGRYGEAEDCLQAMITRGDELPAVYNQYMILKIIQGDFTMARQLLSQVLSFHDDAIEEAALWNEIILLEREHEYKRAYEKLNDYEKNYRKSTEVTRERLFLMRVMGE